jgi:hypothetical protein
MAEIRVEPQRGGRGRVWLLIVLLVLVAAAVWYFATRQGGTSTNGPTAGASTAPASAPATTR